MLGRVVIFIRSVLNYTPYLDTVAHDYCNRYNVKANSRFALKSIIKRYPIMAVIVIVNLTSFIIVGIALRVFERPLENLTHAGFGDPITGL